MSNGGQRGLPAALLAIVVAAAILPCLLARWPPSYDYHHWVFHSHLLASLLTAPADAQPLRSLFAINARPVPNLGVSLGMTFFDLFLPSPVAGRVFLVLTVLVFGLGFRALVRAVQGRPAAIELFGFAWSYGYFLYAGYIGYVFSLGIAFFAIARLHRLTLRPAPWTTGEIIRLGLLVGVVACAHLFAWLVLAGAIGVYGAVLALRRSWQRVGSLLVALLPALVYLGWYTALAWHTVVGENAGTEMYDSMTDKKISLIDSVLLFVRADPLPSPVSIFWANVVSLGLLAAVVAASSAPGTTRAEPGRRLGSLGIVAGIFGAIALFWPFGTLDGMGRPDERMAMPAILLGLAALPHRRSSARAAALAAIPVLGVLLANAVRFEDGSRRIEQTLAVLRDIIPPNDPYISLMIWNGRVNGGCEPLPTHPTVGQATFKWIALERQIETGRIRTHVMGSGLVSNEFRWDELEHVAVFIMKRAQVALWIRQGDFYPPIPFIVLLGCEQDRASAARDLGAFYVEQRSGELITVLRHR
jgi:hypothetical protein